ncbi:DUF1540 domain-containing protein [Anaeromicropila herbilytica]|uniref:DUF1540 domain-containing protein n=1 Tax=Anaeromicropila herbilytica TaxID=2785025 RepID=A0A7R7EKP2_9FIRM|nr:DUF1540 domain-containing protein [Anaeromicropila herbilytica]BCN30509.1 hypothetical protein bsdtb5_18040 [Anaeromicropila herbilytica]
MDKNPSIKCNVTECRYNANQDKYCTLEQIQVGKHDQVTSDVQGTDCNSFQRKESFT